MVVVSFTVADDITDSHRFINCYQDIVILKRYSMYRRNSNH